MTVYYENENVARLVDELFTAVQQAQGFAFCSDGETFDSIPEFFARIRGRLKWNDEASKIIRAFLRKHSQLGEKHPRVKTMKKLLGVILIAPCLGLTQADAQVRSGSASAPRYGCYAVARGAGLLCPKPPGTQRAPR
jgi:hypothetical protein